MEAHVITTLKLAGISAILSAGIVSGFPGAERGADHPAGKLFYDRAGDPSPATFSFAAADPRALRSVDVNKSAKGDRGRVDGGARCTDQAWLLAAGDCRPNFDLSSGRTAELRTADNVSTLVRAVPSPLASR